MMGVISVLIYPTLLGLMGIFIFKIKNVQKTLKKHWKLILLFTVLLFIFLDAFTYWQMRQEHFLYYWDFAGFWRRSVEFNAELKANPGNILKFLYDSILYQEYSSFPQLFLTGHTLLLGNTYPRFILAMVNCFLIPSQILLFIFSLTVLDRLDIDSVEIYVVIIGFLIFFTGNYLPLLLGYVGSIGQVFIALILIIIFNVDFTKQRFFYSILIGIIMLFLVFLRRWYAYYVLAFFFMFPIAFLLSELSQRRWNLKNFWNLILNLFISGLTSLLILFLFFRPLFSMFTGYDYAFAYQSVYYNGVAYAWPWFVNFYSPLQTTLVLIGLVYGILKKELRFLSIFALLSVLMIIFTFYQIQVFGSHHYYIINVWIQMLILFGMIAVLIIVKRPVKIILSGLLIFLFMMNFGLAFISRSDSPVMNFMLKFQSLSTSLYVPPRTRSDVDTIKDIVTYLQEESKDFEYIYVLAGSGIFNDDLLRNAFLPEELNPLPTLEATHHLDTRDGTPSLFFYYTYILVADPAQYHNGADYQHIIGTLVDGMLSDEELRPYYYPLKTFTIENDTKILVFKRIEDIPDSVKEKYRQLFKSIYPEYPFIYDFQ